MVWQALWKFQRLENLMQSLQTALYSVLLTVNYNKNEGLYSTTEQLYRGRWCQIKKFKIGLHLVINIVAIAFPTFLTSYCLDFCSLLTVLPN